MKTNQALHVVALASSILAGCGLLKINGKPVGSASSTSSDASSDSPSSSSSEVGSVTGDTDAHAKLGILDLQIGMPMQQAGFTCAQEGSVYYGAECVKFLDPRCKGKDSHVEPKRYGQQAPRGCFIEAATVATFLDGLLLQQHMEVSLGQEKADAAMYPLVNVHTYGTLSKPSKIARILYTMTIDDLASGDQASDSKLYKALVGKYGKPKEIWSGKVKWSAGSTELVAYCDTGMCSLEATDTMFEKNEANRQEEQDAKVRQNNAPAPKL